jgi:hypothetical protein
MFKTILLAICFVCVWAAFGETYWLARNAPWYWLSMICQNMPDRLTYYTPPIILAILLAKRTK